MSIPEIYLTKEQVYRLVEIANNALVGMQIGSNLSSEGIAYVVSVDIESQDNRHYEIHPDGGMVETT